MATTDNRLPTEGTQIDIEARLAAIETALASLMADTTGQSIASAISGLGTALGSDKANIDGSNIANPSAFRGAISAAKNSWTLLTNIKVTANTSQQVNLDITGYSEFLYIFGTNTAGNEINYARSYVMPGYGTRVNDNYYSTATYSYSSCARVSNVSSSSFTINMEEVTMGTPYQTNGLRFILMAR